MPLSSELSLRSNDQCELCTDTNELTAVTVSPMEGNSSDDQIVVCVLCAEQLEANSAELNINHWRCLNDAIWNTTPVVQVTAYRILQKMSHEDWTRDLIDMMYMDDETKAWATAKNQDQGEDAVVHKDSNGNVLAAGDSVTLIQDLKVKGANFTAKRGTAVRRIRLDPDNAEHIEGKVDGQHIVILTKYVKKS